MAMIEPMKVTELNGGFQRIYRFDNGYGASVVCHKFSYGLELAVIKFTGERFTITYDTGITNDVIGNLTELKVEKILHKIQGLKG